MPMRAVRASARRDRDGDKRTEKQAVKTSHPWWKTHDAKEEAIDDASHQARSLFCARPVPPLPHATKKEESEERCGHTGNLLVR
ncbi:hypothetical protein TgHK011_002744 [Trichoderma gracile]|nr:hypothetical protein TgHK011_002744 [Trichoderma gracile]